MILTFVKRAPGRNISEVYMGIEYAFVVLEYSWRDFLHVVYNVLSLTSNDIWMFWFNGLVFSCVRHSGMHLNSRTLGQICQIEHSLWFIQTVGEEGQGPLAIIRIFWTKFEPEDMVAVLSKVCICLPINANAIAKQSLLALRSTGSNIFASVLAICHQPFISLIYQ